MVSSVDDAAKSSRRSRQGHRALSTGFVLLLMLPGAPSARTLKEGDVQLSQWMVLFLGVSLVSTHCILVEGPGEHAVWEQGGRVPQAAVPLWERVYSRKDDHWLSLQKNKSVDE